MTALITTSPLAIVTSYNQLPSLLRVPGVGDVYNAGIGWTSGNYMLVDVAIVNNPPNPYAVLQTQSLALNGSTLTVNYNYTAGSPTQIQLKQYASYKQLAKAGSGTALGLTPIPTDTTTMTLLSMAFTRASNDSNFSMNWIGSTGTPVTLTAANILNAARQVGLFFGSCKAAEAQAINSVNAGTITTTAQIDALFAF